MFNRKCNHSEVLEELRRLFVKYEVPNRIRSDNGSEFTAKQLQKAFEELDLKTAHIPYMTQILGQNINMVVGRNGEDGEICIF